MAAPNRQLHRLRILFCRSHMERLGRESQSCPGRSAALRDPWRDSTRGPNCDRHLGTGWPPGSYTNYYRYDLWGNPIYSRKVINPSTNSYHESFSTYYNGGLSPGFNAFQETFSQNQGTDPDNTWANQNGYWMVQNGSYNGTDTSSQPESIFAWSDVGKADISIQARVYVTYRINSPDQRIGLLAHYPGTGTNMWALVFHTTTVGAKLSLLEEAVGWRAENSCTIWFNSWYTLNFTMRGNQAWGWTNGLGGSCSVSATFTGALASATGFGLYSGVPAHSSTM